MTSILSAIINWPTDEFLGVDFNVLINFHPLQLVNVANYLAGNSTSFLVKVLFGSVSFKGVFSITEWGITAPSHASFPSFTQFFVID